MTAPLGEWAPDRSLVTLSLMDNLGACGIPYLRNIYFWFLKIQLVIVRIWPRFIIINIFEFPWNVQTEPDGRQAHVYSSELARHSICFLLDFFVVEHLTSNQKSYQPTKRIKLAHSISWSWLNFHSHPMSGCITGSLFTVCHLEFKSSFFLALLSVFIFAFFYVKDL